MQHVFIIGSKGVPKHTGGFETFVDKLVSNKVSDDILYHVACAVDEVNGGLEHYYNGAHCFDIVWKPTGSSRAVLYDIDALRWTVSYIKKNAIEHSIVYILACRVGPFISTYVQQIHNLGGRVFVNPDGHEWMRGKWSWPVRKYWKMSEAGMVKNADLVVCDNTYIESYIKQEYSYYVPKTTYIAYGADLERSTIADDDADLCDWMAKHGVRPYEYYLVVGRFVPENNYEVMVREFMLSSTERDFVIITETEGAFFEHLRTATGFESDPRIKFVGPVYDQEFLKKVREQSYAYLHGHQVGGTNPSLLEALSSSQLNLVYKVSFNREVAADSALYWTKDLGDLAGVINAVDEFTPDIIARYDKASTEVVRKRFTWAAITRQYEDLFLGRQAR